jgi:hypothetical protein
MIAKIESGIIYAIAPEIHLFNGAGQSQAASGIALAPLPAATGIPAGARLMKHGQLFI